MTDHATHEQLQDLGIGERVGERLVLPDAPLSPEGLSSAERTLRVKCFIGASGVAFILALTVLAIVYGWDTISIVGFVVCSVLLFDAYASTSPKILPLYSYTMA